MKKSNNELIKKNLDTLNFLNRTLGGILENYKIGIYDEGIEKLSEDELIKVLDNIAHDDIDTDVKINNKDYVVEMRTVCNKKDFTLVTKEEYITKRNDKK